MDREARTIMVVDSSTSMLFFLGLLLKGFEYRVVTARSGEEALHLMDESLPSVVLSDVALPTMSGVALLKQIRERPDCGAVPVIMHTTEDDPGIRDTCMQLGCAAYLLKPVEPELLYRTIQAASESAPRANIRLRTSLKVMVGDGSVLGGAARTEYATALSEGGLFITTRYPQPRNAVTPLKITIDDREIIAKALVLYINDQGEEPSLEPGMGMKFVQIADADRAVLRRFIREQLTHDIADHGQGRSRGAT
jgi:two-component system, chemotaxis family, chemotaxis protein CheY